MMSPALRRVARPLWLLVPLLLGACAGKTPPPETVLALEAASAALPEGADEAAAASWVLEKNEIAWNAAAAREVGSRMTRGRMELGGMGVSLTAVTWQVGPDQVYMIQSLQGFGDIEMGYDGAQGWARDPILGLRDLEGEELEQIQRMGLSRESDFRRVFSSWRLGGVEEEGGRACYRLVLTLPSGGEETWWVDASTFMIARTDAVAVSPQGRVKSTSRVLAWREVDGIQLPQTLETEAGPINMTWEVMEIVHGTTPDPSLFSKPQP